MVLLRLLVALSVVAIGSAVVLHLLTRDRKYLKFALLTGKVSLVIVLVFFGLMIIERLA